MTIKQSRRDFLRLSWGLGAGFAFPSALSSCGGGESESSAPVPGETFVQPATVQSFDGSLDVTILLAYFSTTLNGKAVMMISINEGCLAPALRVYVGYSHSVRVMY